MKRTSKIFMAVVVASLLVFVAVSGYTMDGKAFLRAIRYELNEPSDSEFLDDRFSYEKINEAAEIFVEETRCITGSQSITTVTDEAVCDLNADFLSLFIKDPEGNYYITYDSNPLEAKDYEKIIVAGNASGTPKYFAIIDDASLPSQVSGTTTSAGSEVGGECTLTDSGATFVTNGVVTGDLVHNTSDQSTGYVVSISGETAVVTALFDGSDNDWTSGDNYVIQPQNRKQVVLDPPPDTVKTVVVYYVKKPEPVYSDYRTNRIDAHYHHLLVKYAVWAYKLRDKVPQEGEKMFQVWLESVRKAKDKIDRTRLRKGWHYKWTGQRFEPVYGVPNTADILERSELQTLTGGLKGSNQ